MGRTFRDIFICETSWLFNINKVFIKLDSYDWFIENYKYQITVALHQAVEKYFKYKLFEKYHLKDTIDFEEYVYLINYEKLDSLRRTHSLSFLYTEISDVLDDSIKTKFLTICGLLSSCYIKLRYPSDINSKYEGKINKKFVRKELELLNILYSKTGCSGLKDTQKFFREIKNLKVVDTEIKQVNKTYSFDEMGDFD